MTFQVGPIIEAGSERLEEALVGREREEIERQG